MTVPASNSDSLSSPDHGRVIARVFALSDVGRARDHNEDTFLVADLEAGAPLDFSIGYHEITTDPHGLLFLVADGMGGAASGELASSMAGSVVLDTLRAIWTPASPSVEHFTESLRDATVGANSRIHQHARENPEHRGMGTTATVAGLLGDHVYMVQVGDSRAYLVRDAQAKQLTKDQSLMQRLVEAGELTPEEAEVSDRRNIILQALGPEAQVTVDVTYQQLRRGDVLVLCSDGLSGLVRAEEIAAAVHDEPDLRVICKTLIDRANQRGGPDNITVIVARFDGDGLTDVGPSDRFGYNAFSLAGTLNDHTREMAITPVNAAPAIRSDPTPKYGTPIPALTATDSPPMTPAPQPIAIPGGLVGGTNPELIQERKRAVQPVYAVLALVAAAAVVWTAWQVLGR
ncbi:MAG TPA: PP2C family serine/threonine-protein phosphatase [Gemmatimonas sp.]|uniref:PP2C family protein-serine/threonine phosphatase n=1 Tax=Gemmatimonas sp. TaxID=1962908 RepID=UPI002EDA496F